MKLTRDEKNTLYHALETFIEAQRRGEVENMMIVEEARKKGDDEREDRYAARANQCEERIMKAKALHYKFSGRE